MADYRPMPRGAYDANGRPIGRWPEPPEPVAPRQDLLPTPAPAPAPVQRTSPGGVGWMPNKQERDMMQDLYPESTQRPPTRLEKFFQWLSGSSDAGADTLYPSNGSNFSSGSHVAPIYGDAKPGGPSQSATAGAYLSAEIGGRPTPVSDAMYRHLGIVPPSPQNTYESYPDHFQVPGGRIGAPSVTTPPSASATTSPEIAIPYAGGTYYRNDS